VTLYTLKSSKGYKTPDNSLFPNSHHACKQYLSGNFFTIPEIQFARFENPFLRLATQITLLVK
jgi:hypothetical protein